VHACIHFVESVRLALEGFSAFDHVEVLFLIQARIQKKPNLNVYADRGKRQRGKGGAGLNGKGQGMLERK
jgi:hypothetical protein